MANNKPGDFIDLIGLLPDHILFSKPVIMSIYFLYLPWKQAA